MKTLQTPMQAPVTGRTASSGTAEAITAHVKSGQNNQLHRLMFQMVRDRLNNNQRQLIVHESETLRTEASPPPLVQGPIRTSPQKPSAPPLPPNDAMSCSQMLS